MMEFDEFRAMNSDVVLAAQGSDSDVVEGFQRARDFILAEEKRLTRFSDRSELMRLNDHAGEWFEASAGLVDVIAESIRLHAETGGLFNPAVLPALRRAGYDRSFDRLSAALGPEDNAHPAGVIPGLVGIEIDHAGRRIRLPAGMQLDLGGIAKGWIVERAARLLAVYAQACAVSAGGDIFLVGHPADEPSWQVTLEDPRDDSRSLAVLRVGPETAIATSSVTRRRWIQAGRPRHHVIDPRTAEPAQSDWLSVTVVAERMTRAEALAKAILIAGEQAPKQMIERAPAAAFFAVDEKGRLWGSPGSKELLDVHPGAELQASQIALVE